MLREVVVGNMQRADMVSRAGALPSGAEYRVVGGASPRPRHELLEIGVRRTHALYQTCTRTHPTGMPMTVA